MRCWSCLPVLCPDEGATSANATMRLQRHETAWRDFCLLCLEKIHSVPKLCDRTRVALNDILRSVPKQNGSPRKGKSSWRCQGCGEITEMRENDVFRSLEISVKSSASSSERLSISVDLCPACQLRLIRLADPREWDISRASFCNRSAFNG